VNRTESGRSRITRSKRDFALQKEEKKVEYLELIYDLIFVYIIGRNNSLLRHVEGGFVTGSTFLVYVFCTLAVIQIWNFSTFYINMHGRNGLRDHIALLMNMYLLYYIGDAIGPHWDGYQKKFHVAWAPILYGMVMTRIFSDENRAELVNFPHLSERAMLYVVFAFGEMIIVIASYFDEAFTVNSIYFSAMCFLIVVELFLCYEVLYDRIIDREMKTAGINYMIIHIFLIFALNNITTSLEFMRDEKVLLWPKILFLIGSLLLYYFCLFALQLYPKEEFRLCRRYLGPIVVTTIVFVGAMILLRENMRLNIFISVVYSYVVFWEIWRFSCRSQPRAVIGSGPAVEQRDHSPGL